MAQMHFSPRFNLPKERASKRGARRERALKRGGTVSERSWREGRHGDGTDPARPAAPYLTDYTFSAPLRLFEGILGAMPKTWFLVTELRCWMQYLPLEDHNYFQLRLLAEESKWRCHFHTIFKFQLILFFPRCICRFIQMDLAFRHQIRGNCNL